MGVGSALSAQGVGYWNKMEPQWVKPAEMGATEEVTPKVKTAGGEISWLFFLFSISATFTIG